ncbi:helix-hairpin-helix domain-containing protein [Streptomyces sp. NPDC004520]|uniref:helix-hairpin-helix domain-containing protein n=1 Tax=Streptomyces sp. NPDC004520 TaxID=3364702 RepID=UPI0036D0F498
MTLRTPLASTIARTEALFPTAVPPVPVRAPLPALAPEAREAPEAPERGSPPGARERLAAALRDRTPVWVQTRCGLEPRALAALAVVLLVAAGLAGAYFWTGRPEEVRAPELVRAAAPMAAAPAPKAGPGEAGHGPVSPGPGAGAGAAPGAGAAGVFGASGASGARVVVDIGGKVRRPGVLTLPAGSRVADALRAAGGAEPGADLTGVNRARVLLDGEQVLVGLPGPPAGGPGPGGGAGGGAPGVPLSLNTATAEQLDGLPGVGPVLAQHIVDHRTEHGGFRSVGELREVDGIGERRFADLEPLVRP